MIRSALGAAFFAGLLATATTATAAPTVQTLTLTATESGGNVVLTFSGSVNTANLVDIGTMSLPTVAGIVVSNSYTAVMSFAAGDIQSFAGAASTFTGSFSPILFSGSTRSGDSIAFSYDSDTAVGTFGVSTSYVSGTAISSSVTLANTTLAALNADQDAYFLIENEVAVQEFVYDAQVTPVPVPASLPLMAAGLGALGLTARRRRG